MTKCLFCEHIRHDFELNCPKCGSFYSTFADSFSTDDLKRENALTKIKACLAHPRHRLIAIGMVIFLIIAVMFL